MCVLFIMHIAVGWTGMKVIGKCAPEIRGRDKRRFMDDATETDSNDRLSKQVEDESTDGLCITFSSCPIKGE